MGRGLSNKKTVMRKIVLLLFLLGLLGELAIGQERFYKNYHVDRHMVGLSLKISYVGLALVGEYNYVFNPKAKFMFMGRGQIGYSLTGDDSPIYHIGGAVAFGRKSRLFLGLGYYYITRPPDRGEHANNVLVDFGYLVFGSKHIYFNMFLRAYYDLYYPPEEPIGQMLTYNIMITIGWAF